MSRARNLADLLDSNGDVVSGALDNVPAADLVNDTTPQLGGTLDTNGNDINFGDNDEARFGAGYDLKIYHDGSNSYIKDAGTGNLLLQAENFEVLGSNNNAIFQGISSTGEARMLYGGQQKFKTTSTGIDVTGQVKTDTSRIDLDDAFGTAAFDAQNSSGDFFQIRGNGSVYRYENGNSTEATINTIRHTDPNNQADHRTVQQDLVYSTKSTGTLWLLVRTPQANSSWEAGGSASFKLTWSGYHASGSAMASWRAVFGNNHGDAFRWTRSSVEILKAPDSYYGYTPGVNFYRQTADGNGYTGAAQTMRNLWIEVTGNAGSNVCPRRTLEISGVVGGPSMLYEVYSFGSTTPSNISSIGASV